MAKTRVIGLLSGVWILFFTAIAFAVPSLQLYMPGSIYNPDTESWLSYDNPFTLQALGAESPEQVDYIRDVTLYIGVPTQYYAPGGSVSLVGEGLNLILDDSNLLGPGTPQMPGHGGASLPPHGIYPTYYWQIDLPDLDVAGAGEIVNNYNPGESGFDIGDIQEFTVTYNDYFLIHMDLSGVAVALKNGEEWKTWNRIAPFSHDADAFVPEPSTMFLLGAGLLGLAGYGRKRMKK